MVLQEYNFDTYSAGILDGTEKTKPTLWNINPNEFQ